MIDQVKIGGFLKSLRKEAGKTQEEIAEGETEGETAFWSRGDHRSSVVSP